MSAPSQTRKSGEPVPEKLEALVAPHVDSFDYFVERGLPEAVRLIPPVEIHDPSKRLRFKVWFENPQIFRPYNEDETHKAVYPSECRELGATYRGDFRIDLCSTHYPEDEDVADADLADSGLMVQRTPFNLGRMPIMVKSSLCHLRNLSKEQLMKRKEESLEMGGYFICNGIERLIRLLILPRRNYPMAIQRSSFVRKGVGFSNKAVAIRCVRADQTSLTLRLVYVNDGTVSLNFSMRKREYFVPLGIVLKALSDTTDAELYSQLSMTAPPTSRGAAPPAPAANVRPAPNTAGASLSTGLESETAGVEPRAAGGVPQAAGGEPRVALGTQFVRERALLVLGQAQAQGLYTRTQCQAYLGDKFRAAMEEPDRKTDAEVGEKLLRDFVLVHLQEPEEKLCLLIFMVLKLYAFVDGTAQEDNPDTLQHQELLLPGHLLTMSTKERLHTLLHKLRREAQQQLQEHPGNIDLRNKGWVAKVVPTIPQIGKDVEYLLNTGNLSSPSGLDLQQKSGFSLVAEKLNFFRYISHFRSVHRGAFFAELRTTSVRKLLPESWGFMCPVHTPDGAPCGLLNHLSVSCQVTTDLLGPATQKSKDRISSALLRSLSSLGMRPVYQGFPLGPAPEFLTVQLDGRIVGQIHSSLAGPAVTELRRRKVSGNAGVPQDTELAYIPFSPLGTFPGIFIFTSPARFLRPVSQLLGPLSVGNRQKPPPIEYIGSLEQVFLDIRCQDGSPEQGHAGGIPGEHRHGEGQKLYSHEEIHPTSILSVIANLTPWSDYNQSPRNMYQCQMGKQTMGVPLHTFPFRWDNKLYRLQTPQTPIARTSAYDQYCMDEYPTGTNAVVAVIAYTGYDMEDAMIINKASMERGFAHGFMYKSETVEANPRLSQSASVKPPYAFKRAKAQLATTIDVDGLPRVRQQLKPDNAYCSTVNTMTGQPQQIMKLKGTEDAVVDGVALLGGSKHKGLQKAVIRMRFGRRPQIGDKFSSRHGQKGVLSQLWPDEDMPFSSCSGMRPDVIINPHAFPSRMTIGMLVESMACKSGALNGHFVNASTFRTATPNPDPLIRPGPMSKAHVAASAVPGPEGVSPSSKGRKGGTKGEGSESVVDVFGRELAAKGFNYHGTETMYSGIYGTEMDCHIYIGVVYYQRLRHMVSDKFQVRSTGPVNPLTQQPVKGRSRGGGIRFGEMERDALLSHGAAYLLHDRLHVCSDYHTADVCSLCGSVLSPVLSTPGTDPLSASMVAAELPLAASADITKPRRVMCLSCKSSRGVVRIAMPFVFRYLAVELAAMNIKLSISIS